MKPGNEVQKEIRTFHAASEINPGGTPGLFLPLDRNTGTFRAPIVCAETEEEEKRVMAAFRQFLEPTGKELLGGVLRIIKLGPLQALKSR